MVAPVAPRGSKVGGSPIRVTAKAKSEPVVVGHRGASGYRPEHTLGSYRLAIQLGADAVEPDLVSTRDGVLVARHENELSASTDVADRPEFADRKATKSIDGASVNGWFTEDFTLRELKTLRARERMPALRQHNTLYDGRYQVPTLQDVVDLVRRESRIRRRRIGIYAETKHPGYFDSISLPLQEPLIRTLEHNGLNTEDSPVVIQSFETAHLRQLAARTPVPLMQLIDADGAPYDLTSVGDRRTFSDLLTPAGLAWIAGYAVGIGVEAARVIPLDTFGRTLPGTTLVDDAHAQGLAVYAWTVRNENAFLPANYRRGTNPIDFGHALGWFGHILARGIDGVFSDHPDTALVAAGLAAST